MYGAIRSGDSGTSAHKFVGALGHPSEDNTGLIYMQARYMDPVTGRFVSEDPAGHGANYYLYCANSPVTAVDGNGKEWKRPDLVAVLFYMTGWSFVMQGFQQLQLGCVSMAIGFIFLSTTCFAIAALGICDFGSCIVITLTALSTFRPAITAMFLSADPAAYTLARDAAIGQVAIGLIEFAYLASVGADS